MPQADHPESAIQTALESFVKIDLDSKDFVLGVAGAGAMGRGIAQVAVAGGMRVRLYDAFPKASAEAAKFIDTMLTRAAAQGRMSAADAQAALGRLGVIENMQDFAPCQVVLAALKEEERKSEQKS